MKQITASEYYLCSKSIIEHFPDLPKSKPFKSGYDWDSENYYIAAIDDFSSIEKYFKEVIEPFNEKSNVNIDFWLYECASSLIEQPKNYPYQSECKKRGVFVTVENVFGVTKERNIAYAIYKMSEYYGLNPIQFANKIGKS
jgi:hypothetical protein